MKTMNCNKAKAMVFTPEEIAVLEKAELILRDVQFRLGDDNVIMSLETGECIVSGSLSIARGVLDFVRTYRMVEINPD